MNARIMEVLSQAFMLNVIEMAHVAEQDEEFLFPGAAEERTEFLDGFDLGITTEDQFESESIVGIDQEGHFLLPGPCFIFGAAHLADLREIVFERPGLVLELLVADLALVAIHDNDVFQEPVEYYMAVVEYRCASRQTEQQQDDRK